METKNNSLYLESIRGRWFRDYNVKYVDPYGLSGGLALWWDKSLRVSILYESQNIIHAVVEGGDFEIPVFCSFVYGPNNDNDRWEVWDVIRRLAPDPGSAWMSVGDYNDIASRDEKQGGLPRGMNRIWKFQNLLYDCGFLDLGFQDPKFTWNNNQTGEHHIKERHDRAVSNHCFLDAFSKVQVFHLDHAGSDHCPVLIYLKFCDKKTPRSFKFEKCWLEHPDYAKTVLESWRVSGVDLGNSFSVFCEKLSNCSRMLSSWSREAFPNNKKLLINSPWSCNSVCQVLLGKKNADWRLTLSVGLKWLGTKKKCIGSKGLESIG